MYIGAQGLVEGDILAHMDMLRLISWHTHWLVEVNILEQGLVGVNILAHRGLLGSISWNTGAFLGSISWHTGVCWGQ